MQKELPRPPRNNRQETELKSQINLDLSELSIDAKIKILTELVEFWEQQQNKDFYLEMGPIWQEQVSLQDDLIRKTECAKHLWALLAILEFLVIIYKFWE